MSPISITCIIWVNVLRAHEVPDFWGLAKNKSYRFPLKYGEKDDKKIIIMDCTKNESFH